MDDSRQLVAAAQTLVVKIGTRSLTLPDGRLDDARVGSLADQIIGLVNDGRRVVLVSSGAVGAGIGRLALNVRPTSLAELQAVAAVGQSCLIEAYNRHFTPHGHHAAQVLLTTDDFDDRGRYLNVRNTVLALFRLGAIPVINENDTVRVDELQRSFGDNDRLAAMVTNAIRAPLLVMLTDVDGVLSRDEPSQVIPRIDLADESVDQLVHGNSHDGIRLSTGGMSSKLEAARIATTAGEQVVIANGGEPNVLARIANGEAVGTLLVGQMGSVSSRKRWIGWAVQPQGQITLDDGAKRAVLERGSSLLSVGISSLSGDFVMGDVVSLVDGDGTEVARGLVNYDADDLSQIRGLSTDKIAEVLGHVPYDEVVHRDNLTLVETAKPN